MQAAETATYVTHSKREDASYKRPSTVQGGNLVLSKVTKEEVGKYVCRAENMAAVRETPQIHLGVHGESLDLIFRVLLYDF